MTDGAWGALAWGDEVTRTLWEGGSPLAAGCWLVAAEQVRGPAVGPGCLLAYHVRSKHQAPVTCFLTHGTGRAAGWGLGLSRQARGWVSTW